MKNIQYLMILIGLALMTSCVTPLATSLDSARTLPEGKAEVSGLYTFDHTSLTSLEEGEEIDSAFVDTESLYSRNNIGLRLGYGITENLDVKFRWMKSKISYSDFVKDGVGTQTLYESMNTVSIIPRYSFGENSTKYSVQLPWSSYSFNDANGNSDKASFIGLGFSLDHRTESNKKEINVHLKLDIPLQDEYNAAGSLGVGGAWSSDLDVWAFRAELGLMFSGGTDADDQSSADYSNLTVFFGVGGSYYIPLKPAQD